MTQNYTVPVTFKIQGVEQLKAANKEMSRMGGGTGHVAKATKGTKNFGFAAQNASYQVQDLIVQIQGGTDPMRALSQQLPQMAVGMGAWGAAIGFAAAAIPALIVLMSSASEGAGTLDEQIEGLQETLDAFNTDSMVREFNDASAAMQGFIAQDIKRQISELKHEAEVASTALSEAFGNMTGGGSAAREASGLSLEVFVRQFELIKQIGEAGGKNLDDNLALRDVYLAQMQTEEGLSEVGKQRYEQLKLIIAAQEQIATLNDNLLTPVTPQGKRIDPSQPGGGAAGTEADTGDGVSAAAQAAIDLNDWNQQQEEFIRNAPKYDEAIKRGAEAWSLADESMKMFEQSFDDAVTGVAMGTQSMDAAFKSMVQSFVAQMGKLLAEWLTNIAVQSLFGGAGGGGGAVAANAKGNVISGGEVKAFARGGVVTGPTVFPMAKGLGLMGEAGAEAVMPLTRMSNGNLGVESSGMNVVINNNAPGIDVTPRQTDNGLTIDVVRRVIAGDLAKGGNDVARAAEQSYGLSRGRGLR